MSFKEKGNNYVSCIRIDGKPILPPTMTDERRKECQKYREQAILVEKRLELARKEREMAENNNSVDGLQSSPAKPTYNEKDNRSIDILGFILEDLRDETNPEIIRKVVDQVTKELQELDLPKNLLQLRCTTRNSDCTSHDIEQISFDQITQSVLSSKLRGDSTYSEKSADENSLNDDCLYSESTFKNLDIDTPDDGKYLLDNISAIHTHSMYNEASSKDNSSEVETEETVCYDSMVESDNKNCENNGDSDDCNESVVIERLTPTNSIRRNSYTLESPSPSVLAYLRDLLRANTPKKSIGTETNDISVSSNNDLSINTNESLSRSVVRNLNDIWSDNDVSDGKKAIVDLSPEYKDSLEDEEDAYCTDKEENRNTLSHNEVEPIEPGENGNEEMTNANEEVHDETDSKESRAAVIIQAYARGFLVRRLMKTQKVGAIKNIIKDAVVCAWDLYKETTITPLDLKLHEQISQQVTGACYELHCIFFKWSTSKKMALLRSEREMMKNPKPIPRIPRRRPSSSKSRSVRSISSSLSDSNSLTVTQCSTTNSLTVTPPSSRGTHVTNNKRPSTLPSIPKSTKVDIKPWK